MATSKACGTNITSPAADQPLTDDQIHQAPEPPFDGIRFDPASIELTETRCWHPGERMEGWVLVRKGLLEGPGRLKEIRLVLRRTIKFPAALVDNLEDDFVSFSALGAFQSEQCIIADQVIYKAQGSKVAAWMAMPRDDTDTTQLMYSLSLPVSDADSHKIVSPVPGIVDFDLVVIISQLADGHNAREAAAIKNLQMTPWDKASIPRIPKPLDVSPEGFPKKVSDWKWHGVAADVEAYPGAPYERPARSGVHLYTPSRNLAAGRTYPFVVLYVAGSPKHESLDKADWGYVMPDLPGPKNLHDNFGLALEAWLEYEEACESGPVVNKVLLPQFELPGVWSDGHVRSRAAGDWAGRPCEGMGWQKPFYELRLEMWLRHAYLVGRITLPDNYPSSFELTTSAGCTIRLRHGVSARQYLDRAYVRGAVTSCFLMARQAVSTSSGHVLDHAEAPPDYVP